MRRTSTNETMRHHLFIVCGMLCILSMAVPSKVLCAGKQDAHISYVLKNLSLGKETVAKFRPVLVQYYQEIARVKAPRKALREKYRDAEESGKFTAKQCGELFQSKQKQEAGELEVRTRYYTKFKTVLSTQQAYEAIRLCNDKLK